MVSTSPLKKQIEDVVRNAEFGITSSQIANQLTVAWRTVNKYLGELVREGRVTSHAVGPYSVFTARKHGEQSISEVLYYGALKVGASMARHGLPQLDKVAEIMRQVWKGLGNRISLPLESEIASIRGEPSAADLERLIEVAKTTLCEFGLFGEYPRTEVIPPLGTAFPKTRLIRLHDPGFIKEGAWTHYYFLASLIEAKLTQKTGIHVIFHVANEIQPGDEVVYFEIGFVDLYYLDVSIFKSNDPDPRHDAHFFLDQIKDYFLPFLDLDIKKIEKEDKETGKNNLHYRVTILDSLQIDEFLTFRAKSLRANARIFANLKLKSLRAWIPYEDWPQDPYLVVDFVTNLGFAFEDYHDAMRETFPKIGYCMHIEKIPSGQRINFLEPFDFDVLFLKQLDDAAVREHYTKLGIFSEEYLKLRKQSNREILAELAQKRIFERKEKKKEKRRRIGGEKVT
jgi:hypothetical protein